MSARGGTSQKFYSGAIVVQPPEALDDFVRAARAGNEFIYCEAPEPMRTAAGWLHAGALARDGLVRTHERQRQGGGKQYLIVRTTKGLPVKADPVTAALADDPALDIIFRAIKRAANFGVPCPSDARLAEGAGLTSRHQASWRVRKLIDLGLISSTLAYEDGVPSRVVTIADGRHAGSAAGKFTALPKKWAALQAAAELDARQTAGGRG